MLYVTNDPIMFMLTKKKMAPDPFNRHLPFSKRGRYGNQFSLTILSVV
jgi:hypothetical protein